MTWQCIRTRDFQSGAVRMIDLRPLPGSVKLDGFDGLGNKWNTFVKFGGRGEI